MKPVLISEPERFIKELQKIEGISITKPSKLSLGKEEFIIYIERKLMKLHFDIWVGQVLYHKKENQRYFLFGEYGEIDNSLIDKLGFKGFVKLVSTIEKFSQ